MWCGVVCGMWWCNVEVCGVVLGLLVLVLPRNDVTQPV